MKAPKKGEPTTNWCLRDSSPARSSRRSSSPISAPVCSHCFWSQPRYFATNVLAALRPHREKKFTDKLYISFFPSGASKPGEYGSADRSARLVHRRFAKV